MLRLEFIGAGLAAGVVAFTASYASAEEFSAKLSGFNELGSLPSATAFPTGAILSNGAGSVKLDLNENSITYSLTYSNVGTTAPNTGNVTQAHIHFGKSRDSGGVMVFFCTNLNNGPAGTPACPTAGGNGTVTGTWTASSVVGPASQNIAPMNFQGLVDALESNTAYANIHTTAYPAGEIRGQVHSEEREHRGDH